MKERKTQKENEKQRNRKTETDVKTKKGSGGRERAQNRTKEQYSVQNVTPMHLINPIQSGG